MHISFHGAAGEVTGSCHLVTAAGRRILVDCGMFQGGRELHELNAEPFGFEPAEIDVLLLTHAHLDHCGRIPLLVRRGFRGRILCTDATRDLARVVMLDSAQLHEEEARRRRHHGQHDAEPLYDSMDALDSLDRFGPAAEYGKPVQLWEGASATFHDAGHILGSASILLDLTEDGDSRSILFSGDVGPRERPFLNPPSPPATADVVVMETTYGDRDHRALADSVEEFHEAIEAAAARGGNVIIPTFALERAQELLFYLREGMEAETLRSSTPVYLDSPMAISATRLFRAHPEAMTLEVAEMIRKGQDPFQLPDLHFVQETRDSVALNHVHSGAIIMAGSGMCTGGRVRHHLRHNLGQRNCSVIFVGFAAEGTLARIIIDGARSIKLFGDHVRVKAHVHTINGFSAHAGRHDLLDWHRRAGTPARTFLIHGEEDARAKFAKALRDTTIEMPRLHQMYEL